MSNSSEALTWLRSIGKEKVQSFQDGFSEMFDISLCLLSLSGEPLTVWSSESLLCHYMQSHNHARCQLQRQQMLQKMCRSGSVLVDNCYMGMGIFACPVLIGGKAKAAFFGGAVDTGDCRISLNEDYHVSFMTPERLKEISKFLDSIISLAAPGNSVSYPEMDTSGQQLINQFGLTPREFTVVGQIMTGKSNKEIAAVLFISDKTVKSHITNILRKMQAKDRKQVMLLCKNYFKNW